MFNHNGLLVISELSGKMGAGHLSLPGTLDVRKDVASAEFQPRLDNVEIGTILTAFNYPISLTGQLTLAGDFSGTKIDADAFRREWQGQAHLDLKNSRMEGLNFQQLVQQAVERSSDVKARGELRQCHAPRQLHHGPDAEQRTTLSRRNAGYLFTLISNGRG